MARFYDELEYPPTTTLSGDEIFIIYKNGLSRTVIFDTVMTELVDPLIETKSIGDFSDITITAPQEDDILKYQSGEWINTSGNPFDQNLNTTNNVEFVNINYTGSMYKDSTELTPIVASDTAPADTSIFWIDTSS